MNFEILETKRLILRKFINEDIQFIYDHFSNKNVYNYLYDNEPPKNIHEAKDILDWCMDFDSKKHMRWCITLKNNKTLIGTCGFHNYDKQNNSAEIGYDLSEQFWKNGYMFEALKTMISFGFKNLNLHRIYGFVYTLNNNSNKLLEKLGFKLEGIIRDKHLFRGKYYDHNLYSLLKNEKE